MSNELIYLASPYSHKDPGVRFSRLRSVCRVAGKLIAEDNKVLFCPIAHSHGIAEYSVIDCMSHKTWMKIDLTLLERCDKLYVVMLEGWAISKGVQEEIEFAKQRRIPIFYLNEQGEFVDE